MAIDWARVRDEVTTHLQALLRINTINPPGNETAAAHYLAQVATVEGIPYEIAEGAPGRGNFVARLRGTGPGRPVALLGHLDVVGVEAEHWTHDPFGGDLADGWVWGGGALDMKNHGAALRKQDRTGFGAITGPTVARAPAVAGSLGAMGRGTRMKEDIDERC